MPPKRKVPTYEEMRNMPRKERRRIGKILKAKIPGIVNKSGDNENLVVKTDKLYT